MNNTGPAGEPARLVRDFLTERLTAGGKLPPGPAAGEPFSVQACPSSACALTGITELSDGETATMKYSGLDLRSMLAHACGASKWVIDISHALQERKLDFSARVPHASRGLLKPLLGLAVLSAHGASVRRTSKERPAIALRSAGAAGRPGLSEAAPGSCSWGRGRVSSPGMSIRDLAGSLEDEFGLPVLDETGLGGVYRVMLEWTDRDLGSLTAALENKLGILAVRESRLMDGILVSPAAGASGAAGPRKDWIWNIFNEVNI